MVCADGSALAISLDEHGAEASRAKSEKFFDAEADPVMEKAVRVGPTSWLFVSFEGMAHEVDFSGAKPAAKPAWSLFTDADRTAKWRVGGTQLLTYHAASGELYALVHQGEKDSHKDGGTEAWVYDLAKREKVRTVPVPNLRAAYLRGMFEIDPGGWVDWLLTKAIPSEGVQSVVVTQDDAPLLYFAEGGAPVLGVSDARTGATLREIADTGIAIGLVVLP
jgi:methylamine dehydrogenase heavy chain